VRRLARFIRMDMHMNSRRSFVLLAAFVLVVVGAGSFIGVSTAPGPWFAALAKPPFNPPGWVFAPVWTLLYVMIAIAGWRCFMHAPKGWAMRLWGLQMALNWAWSFVFFSAHLIWGAFAVIMALWLVIIGFMVFTRVQDRVSALLFLPYLGWVSFAALLNLSIGWLN